MHLRRRRLHLTVGYHPRGTRIRRENDGKIADLYEGWISNPPFPAIQPLPGLYNRIWGGCHEVTGGARVGVRCLEDLLNLKDLFELQPI